MPRMLAVIVIFGFAALIGAQMVVNEIMANPPGTSEEEWIELFNFSDTDYYLDGNWFITDGEGEYFFEGYTIPAGGFITILFNLPDTGDIHLVPDIDADSLSHGIRLANAADDIVLLNIQGSDTLVIDSVTYTSSWGDVANNGMTLERIHTFGESNDPENWDASTIEWGTPGAPNSITGIKDTPAQPAKLKVIIDPNPFNIACAISIASESQIFAKISSLDGRVVETWSFDAGNHNILWTADRMPSGIYIFNASSDSDMVSVPVVLIR